MKIAKNIIIYADGTTRETKQALEGIHFIEPVMIDGDLWHRWFDVHGAKRAAKPVPPGMSPDERDLVWTMVAIESDLRLSCTAAELARKDAEFRARVMRECIWGIENAPDDVRSGQRQSVDK